MIPGFDGLNDRLEQMQAALSGLPDSLPLRSLDDKMRKLSVAVEQFVVQQESRQPQSLSAIEGRLDEISRAIVASAVSASSGAPDTEQMKRIETRISALSRQIEETAHEAPFSETFDRLESISRRVDTIADRLDRPAAQPTMDDSGILNAMDQRFGDLARRIEAGRTEDAAAWTPPRRDDDGILDAIEARFSDLAQRMDTARASEDAIMGLESRLESIATRLDRPVVREPSMDPSLVSNLEAQIAGLSQYLSRPDQQGDEVSRLAPRLDRLESSIVGSRDLMVQAAREAAERAVHALSGAPRGDIEAVSGLAGDLKQLEGLTRKSDERNAKTFEAIHDTLLKIVDRLGSLEHTGPAVAQTAPAARRKFEMPDTPPIDPSHDLPDVEADEYYEARPQWTPAEAASAAAEAALGDPVADPAPAKQRRSMLGGLSRAFSRKNADETSQLPGMEQVEPEMSAADLDEPLDPSAANRPLEPGSGAPDLNAIMRRVRDDRSQTARQADADAAKTDFIAAARRAAQAAAAEAEIMKRNVDAPSTGGKGGSLGEALKARRKPILMAAAAVMIALAGLQLGKSFLNDPNELAVGEPDAMSQQTADSTSAEPKTIDEQPPAAEIPAARQAEETSSVGQQPDVPAADGDAAEVPAAEQPDAMAASPDEPMENLEAMAPAPAAATPAARPRRTSRLRTPRCRRSRRRRQNRRSRRCRTDPAARSGCRRRQQGAVRGRRALCRWPRRQGRYGGCIEVVRAVGRARFRAGAIPHRQSLRKGQRGHPRHRQGENLVPARRQPGQRQRHAQPRGAVRHGRQRRDRQ